MFKNIVSTILVCLIGFGLSNTAAAAQCGDIVTSSISLTADLDCSSGDAALEVRANNVTIDLNGYILSGTAGLAGILVQGYTNLTVTNGNIQGFYAGVNANQTTGLKVNNITFYELGSGVLSNAGNNAIIENNTFIRADTGVSISNRHAKTSSNNNLIDNNEFYQDGVGVSICGDQSDSNSITNNLIWKTSDYGIHLTQSDRNQIVNNRILETNNTAIRLSNSSYSNIRNNTLREGQTGLAIFANATTPCLASGANSSHKNSFEGNYAMGYETGVQLGLGEGSNAQVLKNTLIDNKIYDDSVGIYFESDAHQNITRNGYQGTITAIIDNGIGNTY